MRLLVGLVSLAATYLFFYEYLPPAKRVHLFSDIETYHYPLLNYGFKELKQGRFPQWDWCNYSGTSFVGNPQAGLFYPPNWLMYFANRKRGGLKFYTVEALEFLHVWIAFFLAWLWLKGRFPEDPAAFLGAGAFAYGGYSLAEQQHLGMICGVAWYPLAMWGIDESVQQNRWRPLWKTAVASALCFLAGYPSTWFSLCAAALFYAVGAGGLRASFRALAALGFSLLLMAVQLGPSFEVAGNKLKETVYGGGLPRSLLFYLGYFMPGYYNQSQLSNDLGPADETYLYLGCCAIIGVIAVFVRRRWREAMPAFAMIAGCALLGSNPMGLMKSLLIRLPFITEMFREWNLIAVLSLAGAYLTACGLAGLQKESRRWVMWLGVGLAVAWSLRQWMIWTSGTAFAVGWWTLSELAVSAGIAWLLLRSASNRIALAVLLMFCFVEYKVYGTSRRFNAQLGDVDLRWEKDMRIGGKEFTGVDDVIFAQFLQHKDYRLTFDTADGAGVFRHYGLLTPQGFDPFLTVPYRNLIEKFTPFDTNRILHVDWKNDEMMDVLAIRYVLAASGSENDKVLIADSRFRLLDPPISFFHTFEYLAAKPIHRFDAGTSEVRVWTPGQRVLHVRSERGGRFELHDQFQPGWIAFVDGQRVPIQEALIAFQSIEVPAGEHIVEFRYRSMGLQIGAVITMAALVGLVAFLRASGSSRERKR